MSPPAPEPSSGDPKLPPNKRRKAQLACHPCRARKTGCDGHRPCCSSCRMRGWQDRCTYQESTSFSSSLTPYVLGTYTPSVPGRLGVGLSCWTSRTLGELDRRVRKLEESAQVKVPFVPYTTQGNDLVDIAALPKDNYDNPGQDAAVQETDSPVNSAVVCKATSNSSFVQQVASVIGSDFEHVDKTGTGIGFSKPCHSPINFNTKGLVLPPRQQADSLLQCYWELFHPIYPVLHRPTFHDAYSQLWLPTEFLGFTTYSKVQDVVFYSMLNIVLAIGCQRNEGLTVPEREDLADEFYSRSVKLVSIDALDTSSLELVQLLILRGFYLLCTPHADRCWVIVGVALRIAQAIGLQLAKPTVASTQLNREMRRRVWYNCFLLDWMTSLSFDRPRALSKDASVPVPQPIDDEYLSKKDEGQQPHSIPSRLTFFIYAIKLLNIRERSRVIEIQNLKTDRAGYSGQELGAILDLISDLDHFSETLPTYLQVDHGHALESVDKTCFQLQARVLKARVMYARLSMLRPFIVAEANRCVSATALDRDTPQSILNTHNRLYTDLCSMCVSTAHDTLETLSSQLSSPYRSSPWHTLYFTFAAASVLAAATLCPYLGQKFDQPLFEASWNKALRIFSFHKAHVASAEKGIEALEKLRNYIQFRGATTQAVGASVNRDIGITPASGSSLFTPSMTFDSDLVAETFPDMNIDPAPMDESWFVSQDFYFDDGIIRL